MGTYRRTRPAARASRPAGDRSRPAEPLPQPRRELLVAAGQDHRRARRRGQTGQPRQAGQLGARADLQGEHGGVDGRRVELALEQQLQRPMVAAGELRLRQVEPGGGRQDVARERVAAVDSEAARRPVQALPAHQVAVVQRRLLVLRDRCGEGLDAQACVPGARIGKAAYEDQGRAAADGVRQAGHGRRLERPWLEAGGASHLGPGGLLVRPRRRRQERHQPEVHPGQAASASTRAALCPPKPKEFESTAVG